MICTLLRMAGLRGGRGVRLTGLQRDVALPTAKSAAEDSGAAEAALPTPDQLAAVAATRRTAVREAMDNRAEGGNGNGNGNGNGGSSEQRHGNSGAARHEDAPPSARETVRGQFRHDNDERPINNPR